MLTYSATRGDDTALPDWLSFDDATRTFSGVPGDVGTLTVKVKASDGKASISDVFDIVVSAPTPSFLVPAQVPDDWALKPSGLGVGDEFRLIFATSTKDDATSGSISTYNTFVQERAVAGHGDIQAYARGFRVVGCTSAVDATENTGTTGTGVPIYWLDGAKVADDYADFYDGSWDNETNPKNEFGNNRDLDGVNSPFTGCDDVGAGVSNRTLGKTRSTIGRPNDPSGDGPLTSDTTAAKLIRLQTVLRAVSSV